MNILISVSLVGQFLLTSYLRAKGKPWHFMAFLTLFSAISANNWLR
jgi:hypothetical protein